jgi:heavy metal translocating P-type ATPase
VVRSFFRVDGMSRAVDETFLRSVAVDIEGVVDAEASYVTETVRVDHVPDTSVSAITDALSTLGFDATVRRSTTSAGRNDQRTRETEETIADRKRSLEDLLSTRYVVGIVFGSFMLLPYVVFLYPTYLAPFVGGEFADLFGGGFEDGGISPILPLFGVVSGVVVVFTGLRVLRGGYVSLKLREVTTDLLVSLTILAAYCYSVVAMAIGRGVIYFDLAVVVAAGVMALTLYEVMVKRRALDKLTDLTVSQVRRATRYEDSATGDVAVEDLDPGDRILVREGERVPVDGTLAEGQCTVDEAVVTGESLPIVKREGDPIVGGSLVQSDAAVVEVDERGSTIDRITTALWSIQSADHGIQRRADRVASFALPVVVGAAVLGSAIILGTGGSPVNSLLWGLLGVFVTAPWTLGVASPLSVATSMSRALDRGIVVFDETVFERLRSVDVVVFDKTGTLTTGTMEVLDADAPADLLKRVATLERRASHPAANAIVRQFGSSGEADTTDAGSSPEVSDFETHPTGVSGTVDGSRVLVGHPDLFESQGWAVDDRLDARVSIAREAGRLPILVGRDGTAAGIVVLGDEPRPDWESVVDELDRRDVSVIVLTGDDSTAAQSFENHAGIDHVFAGVRPAGKAAAVRRISANNDVAMVGDGTNDAPALAAADLGIALETGTALAADAADVALVDDDLSLVTTAFDVAASAGERTDRNVWLAFAYPVVTIPIAILNLVNPLFVILAVLLSGGTLAANSLRNFDLSDR